MSNPIRVLQYGLGPIGCAMARHILERSGLELVGGVDVDPNKVGKDLGQAIGAGRDLNMKVAPKLADVKKTTKFDVVLHTTNSYFDLFKPQIIEILEEGYDIVSTSEELSFPWIAHAKDAEDINKAAKKVGKTVLATGVNPGFLMDALPLMLTAICQRVDRIEVLRLMNASERRGPFQKKIGCGMTVEEFKKEMAKGRMGHVGLSESVGMVFDTLSKKLVRFETIVEPVVADKITKSAFFNVKPGFVRGLKQVAQAYSPEGEFLTLTFIATLGEPDQHDHIKITGQPNLEVRLTGTNGDIATIAIAVNAIRRVFNGPHGLMTMRDLPIVTTW
jgi:4-hydroxy-tetrahydrodipicolinate reductase